MHPMPSLVSVMSPFPWSVQESDSVAVARETMARHTIRHLPVLREGSIGLVTLRELEVAGAVETVGELPVREAFVIDWRTRLDRVVEEMASGRREAALVMRDGKLVGILTTTDVCVLLTRLLRDRYLPGPERIA